MVGPMITHLSVMQPRQAADLKEKIEALQTELEHVFGAPAQPQTTEIAKASETVRPRKAKMSAKGLANIRAGVAKRMAKKGIKAAGKPLTRAVKSVAAPAGKSGMSMKAAILKALASGGEMSKPALAAKVAVLRGTKTNLGTFSPLLRQMKGKDKTITNPSRGFWKLR